jgi:two-component system, cell cycle sensor histidine kinase and response regulator CckA
MAFPQATRPRLLAAFSLAAGVALLGLVLKNNFASASYDSLHSLAGVQSAATADSPVVIVYLDLTSFLHEHQDPAQPWPRDLHAQLLQRLTMAGAKAVVFDIVFGNAGPNPDADKSFAAAIRDNGHVVLAAEFNSTTVAPDDQHNWGRFFKIEPLYAPFVEAAATNGIASQGIDDDNVVRRYVAGFNSDPQPTLTWAAASWLHLPVTQANNALAVANQKWVRYYGPPLTIPHISYAQVLEARGVTDDFIRDKIVFVGARPQVELFNESKDEFRNPFHSWKYKNYFMPGVEVHATEMLNLIRNDALQRVSPLSENLLLLAVALLFGGGLIWLRPVPATVLAIGGSAFAPALALAGFAHGIWFPWLVISAAQIPAALFGSWLYQFQDWFFTRRKMEDAKKIAEAKIREQAALIDKAHDAILVQDLNGKIIYANRSAGRLYGWNLDELQRDDACADLFSPDSEAAKTARVASLRDGEWNGELHQRTKTGAIVIAASRWTLIRDEAGRPRELLLINSDITEQKNLEQQFLRTQRMNTIGTLAGGMAHDLNNALSPVLLGAQLLRRKSGNEDDRKMLTMIETSANRGADMVRQMLLFARGRGGEFERLELGPLVKELEKMVRETFPKNISVETFLPRDLWPAQGNLTQLHQVLLNLCVNARDAMPDGGKLSFVADNVELTEADAKMIPDAKAGKFISVSVSDTGTGMPPEVQAKIFEPFFTTKGEGKGTGIGLATVVRILKSHGGFLRVESTTGQGTTFEIFISVAEDISAAAPKLVESDLPRGHGELILIADDEQVICELVAAELQEFGYRVLTATNGAEAVTLFKQHGDEVRLFITDNSMPVLSGPQAIAAMRKIRPGLAAILVSGETAGEKLDGVTELNKPFALAELLNAVSHCLK